MARALGAIVVVLLVATLVVVYRGEPPPPAASPAVLPSPSATPIHSIRLPSPTPDDSIVAAAAVVPVRSAAVAFPTAGVVDTILVEEEETVASGEVLMRLDRRERQAAVNAAEAELERAVAALEGARAARDLLPPTASDLERQAADADVAFAEAEVAARGAAVQQRLLVLAQAELRAPFAGTVSAIDVAAGEHVTPDMAAIELADLTSWRLETTDLTEFDVVRVAEGHPADIAVDALPSVRLRGVVERIQVRGTTQDGAVTYTVIIAPERHEPRLRWNMSATVSIATDP